MSATTAVVEVLMPRLSDSMEEGTITAWHKASGDEVSDGEEIVDIETDKAVMTYAAEASGVLEIVAREGTTVKLGGVIGRLLPPRADVTSDGRLNASPVARRVAADLSVDLVDVTGSGPNGRVIKRDVLAAARPTTDADHPPRATPGTPTATPTDAQAITKRTDARAITKQTSTRPTTRLQQTIARRMALAKSTQPEFTLETTVDMTDAVALREQIKFHLSSDVPSLNDLVIKASALALREHPLANGSFVDDSFELHARINIGIAVATQDALIVPVINDADEKSVAQIAHESRRLAARVRDGAITPSDLSGGTFTISNLGMFGIDRFTAILNPPQAAILAVGAVNEHPVFRSGDVIGRKLMALTLTCDHRILYGATAAEFLREMRAVLEHPWRLLL